MKRTLMLLGALAMSITLVGCSSDARKDLISSTMEKLKTAESTLSSANSKIKLAVENAKGSKTDPDFKDAIIDVENLKTIATRLKENRNKANELKANITPEEQADLVKQFKGDLNLVISQLAKATEELRVTLARFDKEGEPEYNYRDLEKFKELRFKINEANSDFEAITRVQ
jgi:outer membrane murein-binding lipoprotein Lpp